jgi:hypothetical protein
MKGLPMAHPIEIRIDGEGVARETIDLSDLVDILNVAAMSSAFGGIEGPALLDNDPKYSFGKISTGLHSGSAGSTAKDPSESLLYRAVRYVRRYGSRKTA